MMMNLEFDWDPLKAQGNLRKHRVPFLKACEVFKDVNRLERLDNSGQYGEERWNVLGPSSRRSCLWSIHNAGNESD
jgi:uncharacterized DUF497 family protein